jgi:phosphomannomutase
MFTASHNPAPYCGIKYIPDYAGPATPEITDTIVANIEGADDSSALAARTAIKFPHLTPNLIIYSSSTPCWMLSGFVAPN